MNNKKVKTVLFVFHNTNFYSGATRSLLDLIDNIIATKEIKVIAMFPKTEGSAIDYLQEKNITTISCNYEIVARPINEPFIRTCIAFPYRLLRAITPIYRIYKMQESFKNYNIDLVYTNTSVILIGAIINKLFKIPHIWHFREFRRDDHQIIIFFGETLFYRIVNKCTDKIIVISESMYKKNIQYIKGSKLTRVYNEISNRYINPKKNFYKKDRTLNLLVTGTLSVGKGQIEALQAINILIKRGYDLHLNIAGNKNCEYYEVLKKYVDDKNLNDYVTFCGHVEDVNKLRSEMDVALITSKNEAFGRVTIEGMLSELVVVGTNSGGTSELIQNNETGLLYTSGVTRELANHIEYLYENPCELQRIAKSGYKYAISEFASGKCSKDIQNIILNLTNK